MNRPLQILAQHATDTLPKRVVLLPSSTSRLLSSSFLLQGSLGGSKSNDDHHDDDHNYSRHFFRSVKTGSDHPMRVRCRLYTVPARKWMMETSTSIRRRSRSLTSWTVVAQQPAIGAAATTRKPVYFSTGSNSGTGNGTPRDGQDHHASFQEQLKELEQERTLFFGNDNELPDDGHTAMKTNVNDANSRRNATESFDFSSHLVDWESEQTTIFGRQLEDHDSSMTMSVTTPQEHEQDQQQHDDGDSWEEMKEEREILYQFTDEERVAWGSRPQAGSLQQVLAEVAKARLLAATDDEKSEQQHGGNDEKNDTVLGHDNNNSRIILSPTNNLNGVVPSIPSTQQHESFSHLSEDGRSIHMVDVGGKEVTARMAHAQSKVILPQSVLEAFGLLGGTSSSSSSSDEEMVGPKGPIFTTAKLAGIMAAKRTSDLIPLCHPLPLDQVQIDIRLDRYIPPTSADSHGNNDDVGGNKARGYGVVTIDCTCRVTHRTGVEMEALTGATVAALTVYDMTKAVSHEIEITGTKLIAKTGGKRVVQRSPPNAANEN